MKLIYETNHRTRTLRDDELMHWKYIKREKINGKWRYYYDENANKLTTYKRGAQRAQKDLDYNFNNFYNKRYKDDLSKAKSNVASGKNPDAVKNVNNWYASESIKKATKETYSEGRLLRWTVDHYNGLYNTRKKTINGKIDSFMSKHGKTIAKNINVISDTISKGAKAVTNLFKKSSNENKKQTKTTTASKQMTSPNKQAQAGNKSKNTATKITIPRSKGQSASKTKQQAKNASSEYWKELEYNSRKNKWR